MSKITIVSRDDQALLIDISGCATFKEAIEQLSSTFLTANEFWQDQMVDINLGSLNFNKSQVAQIVALANGVGAKPKQVFAKNTETINALEALDVNATKGKPETGVSSKPKETLPKESLPTEPLSTSDLLDEPAGVLAPIAEVETTVVKSKIEQVIVFDGEEQINTAPAPKTLNSASPYEVSNSQIATELETREDIVICKSESSAKTKSEKTVTLYLKQNLRAGQAVSHNGDLIIIGDVNAGAEVMAEGDITIWGSLRGIAHAGIAGNAKAEIRALRLQPIQIRIANYIARSPDGQNPVSAAGQSAQYAAEVAKLVNGKIRILRNTFDG